MDFPYEKSTKTYRGVIVGNNVVWENEDSQTLLSECKRSLARRYPHSTCDDIQRCFKEKYALEKNEEDLVACLVAVHSRKTLVQEHQQKYADEVKTMRKLERQVATLKQKYEDASSLLLRNEMGKVTNT
jgi:phage shock protein A